jgi:hypothetical protein
MNPIRANIAVSLAVAGFFLAGCASGEPPATYATPLEISPGTQGALDAYLRSVKVTRPGAFAVSEDGRDSYYVWCEEFSCDAVSYATPAIQLCRSISGKPCLALFVRNQPRVAFTRALDGDGTGRHGSRKMRPIELFNAND